MRRRNREQDVVRQAYVDFPRQSRHGPRIVRDELVAHPSFVGYHLQKHRGQLPQLRIRQLHLVVGVLPLGDLPPNPPKFVRQPIREIRIRSTRIEIELLFPIQSLLLQIQLIHRQGHIVHHALRPAPPPVLPQIHLPRPHLKTGRAPVPHRLGEHHGRGVQSGIGASETHRAGVGAREGRDGLADEAEGELGRVDDLGGAHLAPEGLGLAVEADDSGGELLAEVAGGGGLAAEGEGEGEEGSGGGEFSAGVVGVDGGGVVGGMGPSWDPPA
mmetsp:Transcript_14456/g.28907  ORF Transcript_14456/g.28907 Transcript_14456/m.28907 type:complete len:271 (-) Transcript_14456:881-1693(-)